jgi:hypothetical protein
MQGLLADANVEGHRESLRRALQRPRIDLWDLLVETGIRFTTLDGAGLRGDVDDRTLWNFCQNEGWVLFTDNRNLSGPDSLEATLDDSWRFGNLPVLTLSSKERFEGSSEFIERVAEDVADLLFGIQQGEHSYQPRIYVPKR